jgi:hypothetical protein
MKVRQPITNKTSNAHPRRQVHLEIGSDVLPCHTLAAATLDLAQESADLDSSIGVATHPTQLAN